MAKKKKIQTLSIIPTAQEEVTKFQESVKAGMPEFIRDVETKEDLANSMFETGQELLLAVADVLIRYFDFDEGEIKDFHKKLEKILRGIEEYEKYGFNIMTPHSIAAIGDLVQTRYLKNRMTRSGIDYPILPGGHDFLKKIVGKKEKES